MDVLRSRISGWIASSFLLVFTLGATLVIWQLATGENPVANALAAKIEAQTQLPSQ